MTSKNRLAAIALASLAPIFAVTPVAAQEAQDKPVTEEMSRGEQRLAQALEGRVAGEPEKCLQMSRISGSTIYDETAIVYRVGSTLYVNRPEGGLNFLDSRDIMVNRVPMGQLCDVDRVQMMDQNGFMSGVVFLGEFVPYTKPDKED